MERLEENKSQKQYQATKREARCHIYLKRNAEKNKFANVL